MCSKRVGRVGNVERVIVFEIHVMQWYNVSGAIVVNDQPDKMLRTIASNTSSHAAFGSESWTFRFGNDSNVKRVDVGNICVGPVWMSFSSHPELIGVNHQIIAWQFTRSCALAPKASNRPINSVLLHFSKWQKHHASNRHIRFGDYCHQP